MNRFARESRFEAVNKQIMYTLNAARVQALNEYAYYNVQFDVAANKYWIESMDKTGTSLFRATQIPDDIKIASISRQQIIFNPDGTSEDFSITLKNTYGVLHTINLQGVMNRYSVEWITKRLFLSK